MTITETGLAPEEIRRRRVAYAMTVARVSLRDVWRHVERDGPVCSYNYVQKIANGAAAESDIATRIRASFAELTGQTVEALFHVEPTEGPTP
jgi:hypothetical protein